jgi:hypothetical protein
MAGSRSRRWSAGWASSRAPWAAWRRSKPPPRRHMPCSSHRCTICPGICSPSRRGGSGPYRSGDEGTSWARLCGIGVESRACCPQLQQGMESAYVDTLMAGVRGLHQDIVSEIRSQVASQLHEKVSYCRLHTPPVGQSRGRRLDLTRNSRSPAQAVPATCLHTPHVFSPQVSRTLRQQVQAQGPIDASEAGPILQVRQTNLSGKLWPMFVAVAPHVSTVAISGARSNFVSDGPRA